MEGSCEYIERTVKDSRERVVVQLAGCITLKWTFNK
jgi:hypothetical protein